MVALYKPPEMLRRSLDRVRQVGVGPRPRLSAAVIVAGGSTAALQSADVPGWWMVPVALVVALAVIGRRRCD